MTQRHSPGLMFVIVVVCCLGVPAAAASEQRFIVRTDAGLNGLQVVTDACSVAKCTVRYGLDGTLDQLFLVTTADAVDPGWFIQLLPALPGIQHAEVDAVGGVAGVTRDDPPPALLDAEPLTFFGSTVRGGYLRQPANVILGITTAHEAHGLTGAGVVVAVIDTGVDPAHPVLHRVLSEGYDFTRNRAGGSECADVNQSVMWAVDGAQPAYVNQSTMAMLDQSTMAMLDDPEFRAFGHGTMVAGLIHLVAPNAGILPLKAFRADGTGYTSDVLRAIYHAVHAGAKVINMSFSFAEASPEVARAVDHATSNGVVSIASVGNEGRNTLVYPAALPGVIGVAATTNEDALSAFSNFGEEVAFVAAPGEGVVTTYPMGTYAAAWGTSFSAPFAAGAAALLAQVENSIDAEAAAEAEGHAVWISPWIDRGRLDIPAAIGAWRQRLGQ